jgi:hypothetical protein
MTSLWARRIARAIDERRRARLVHRILAGPRVHHALFCHSCVRAIARQFTANLIRALAR